MSPDLEQSASLWGPEASSLFPPENRGGRCLPSHAWQGRGTVLPSGLPRDFSCWVTLA